MRFSTLMRWNALSASTGSETSPTFSANAVSLKTSGTLVAFIVNGGIAPPSGAVLRLVLIALATSAKFSPAFSRFLATCRSAAFGGLDVPDDDLLAELRGERLLQHVLVQRLRQLRRRLGDLAEVGVDLQDEVELLAADVLPRLHVLLREVLVEQRLAVGVQLRP